MFTDQTDNTSPLLAVLAFDYELSHIEEVLARNRIDNVVQYVVSSSGELVASSVGETLLSPSGEPKQASSASNFIIRESAQQLAMLSSDGTLEYESWTDGEDYLMQVTTFREDSSLVWRIVLVAEEDHTPEMSVKSRLVLGNIDAALDDFTQNTLSAAGYLHFMTGKLASAPLDVPVVESGTTASLQSVTPQALWGVMTSFVEVEDVMLTYSNQKMFHFHADRSRMFYREAGESATYDEYLLQVDGSVDGEAISSVAFDPTEQEFYTVATESPAWSGFFADPSSSEEAEIAFSRPFFSDGSVDSSSGGDLEGVLSTTLYLKDFSQVLQSFAEESVVYFLLDEELRLVASSTGEVGWRADSQSLKFGNSSEETLVSLACTYLAENDVAADNTFILQNERLGARDMIISVKSYSDELQLLQWRLVSSQYYDEDSWTSSDSEESDDEVAVDAAIATGALLFLLIVGLVAMLVTGRLVFRGKGEEEAKLNKDGSSAPSHL